MIKWITATVLFLFLCICAVAMLHEQSSRYASIIIAKSTLRTAGKDYVEYGFVTNVYAPNDRIWLSSNVVTIAGTTYKCYVEIGGGQFERDGTLAMTTNRVFIWIDRKRPPKIIDDNYRPRLFPAGF
jgi:hypothetical protein